MINDFALLLTSGLIFIVSGLIIFICLYGVFVNLAKREYKMALLLTCLILFFMFCIFAQLHEIQNG